MTRSTLTGATSTRTCGSRKTSVLGVCSRRASAWRTSRLDTRDPAYQAWHGWNREETYCVTEIDGIGPVESWHGVTDVNGPLVSFRSTAVFASDGERLISDSTLRFRELAEVQADLAACGYRLDDVRDAPTGPDASSSSSPTARVETRAVGALASPGQGAFEGGPVGRLSVRRKHVLDRQRE